MAGSEGETLRLVTSSSLIRDLRRIQHGHYDRDEPMQTTVERLAGLVADSIEAQRHGTSVKLGFEDDYPYEVVKYVAVLNTTET